MPTDRNVRVLFRVDACAQIGFGHLRRCLSLADALADCGFACDFAVRGPTEAVSALFQQLPHALCPLALDSEEELAQMRELLAIRHTVWLVVDHYQLDSRWRQNLSKAFPDLRIAAIVDRSPDVQHCDLLVDPNLGVEGMYDEADLAPSCRLCAGAFFALLDRRFHRERMRRPGGGGSESRFILVSLGGGDCESDLKLVCSLLADSPIARQYHFIVLQGPAAGRRQEPELANFTWLEPTDDMPGLLARVAGVVGSVGVSALERMCLGIPSLCIERVENQAGFVSAENSAGLATVIDGYWREPDSVRVPRLRIALEDWLHRLPDISREPHPVIDGLGAPRVAAVIAGEN